VDVICTVWQQEEHSASKVILSQLSLVECTFPSLLFLHHHPFSCLRKTWWDGVKQYVVWRETGNPGSPGRMTLNQRVCAYINGRDNFTNNAKKKKKKCP